MPSNPRICDFLGVHIYDHPTWLGIISCWTAGLLDELLNRNIKYFYLENNHHCRQGEKTKHANHQSYVVLVVEMEMFKYWSIRMSTINEINHITFFCCNTFSFLFCSSISLTVIVWTSSSSCWGELLTKCYNYTILPYLFFNHQFCPIQFWHSKRHLVFIVIISLLRFPTLSTLNERDEYWHCISSTEN